MNDRKKKIAYGSIIVLVVLIVIAFFPAPPNLDPADWVKVTVCDTIKAPVEDTWALAGSLDFKSVAGDRKYDALPEILRTRPAIGDFSKKGDSRIIYFSTGDTLVETILAIRSPYEFEYEITKPSLPLKWAAYKARGQFLYSALNDKETLVKWTYFFQQKNFISRFFIQKYIDATHKAWMTDMLKATKTQTERQYFSKLGKN